MKRHAYDMLSWGSDRYVGNEPARKQRLFLPFPPVQRSVISVVVGESSSPSASRSSRSGLELSRPPSLWCRTPLSDTVERQHAFSATDSIDLTKASDAWVLQRRQGK